MRDICDVIFRILSTSIARASRRREAWASLCSLDAGLGAARNGAPPPRCADNRVMQRFVFEKALSDGTSFCGRPDILSMYGHVLGRSTLQDHVSQKNRRDCQHQHPADPMLRKGCAQAMAETLKPKP